MKERMLSRLPILASTHATSLTILRRPKAIITRTMLKACSNTVIVVMPSVHYRANLETLATKTVRATR